MGSILNWGRLAATALLVQGTIATAVADDGLKAGAHAVGNGGTLAAFASTTKTHLARRNIRTHLDAERAGAAAPGRIPAEPAATAHAMDSTGSFQRFANEVLTEISFDSARGDRVERFFVAGDHARSPDGAASNAAGSLEPTRLRARPDVNAWLYSDAAGIEGKRLAPGDARRFGGDVFTATAGADYRLGDSVLGGVALSYSSGRLEAASADAAGSDAYDETAYTIAPYASWRPTGWLRADVSAGYTYTPTGEAQAEPGADGIASEARSYFGALTLAAHRTLGALTVAPSIDYTHIRRRAGRSANGADTGDTASSADLLRTGGEARFTLERGSQTYEPFVTSDVLAALRGGESDRLSGQVRGGFRWHDRDLALNASLTGTTTLGEGDAGHWQVRSVVARDFRARALAGTLTPTAGLGFEPDRTKIDVGLDYAHRTTALHMGVRLEASRQRTSVAAGAPRDAGIRYNLAYRF